MEYKKSFITFGIVLVSIIGSAVPVYAEDVVITVSDNGGGSSNEVNVSSNNTTTVTQNNESHVENNVNTNVNTGDNTANTNTGGDTSIQTGNATTNTTITNENINTNYANSPASGGGVGGNVTINNNGAFSQNSVNASATHTTNISQNNSAHITNNALTTANTGYNSANKNNGNVSIKTGSIEAVTTIENKKINNSVAKIIGACDGSCVITHEMVLKIFGNGKGSVNSLEFNYDDSKTYSSNNLANIYNNAVHNLNTGENSANGNNGDVSILSGDVKSVISITNDGINSNTVVIDCGCIPKPEEPEEPVTPNNPNPNGGTGGGGSNGGGGSSSGDVLGAAIGQVLPATGNLFMLWATIASLILFFSGWYLRFRSGCAPGLAR
jgi:hypothetical protein